MISDKKRESFVKRRTKILMLFYKGGVRRAEYLKGTDLFGCFGENCYYFPRVLPAEPSVVKIHNNVNIATSVYFCDHDVIHRVLNNMDRIKAQYGEFEFRTYPIELFDNVFIGAHSIIMGGVSIGPNAIVAAGSVVTKDVQSGVIVGGNPARVIGTFDDYVKKRAHEIDTSSN